MKTTKIFFQFYRNYKGAIILSNGFSDAYSHCKNIGEFVWVNQDNPDYKILGSSVSVVFVSCISCEQEIVVFNYARLHSDIQFIIGGPAVINPFKYTREDFPENVIETKLSVEEYFNFSNFSGMWGIDVSSIKDIIKDKIVSFNYSIETKCYWGKCIFCKYCDKGGRIKTRYDLDIVHNSDISCKLKQIRFSTPGFNKTQMLKILPQFIYQDDIKYDFFCRCDTFVPKMLDTMYESYKGKIPQIKFRLGIEFPTVNMLKFMNKGFTLQSILNTLDATKRYNLETYTNFIVGWPNITPQDVIDVEMFVNETYGKLAHISIWRLYCPDDTTIHEMYKNQVEEYLYHEGFYKGYFPELSDKALQLNKQAKNYFKLCSKIVNEPDKENI